MTSASRRGMSLPVVAAIMVVMLLAGAIAVYFIQSAPRPRHLILLVLDTVRADHLSCYGYDRDTTPNLDRFAEEGLLFEQARSVSPWTLPSHATLFTGTLPDFHGCHWEHRYLSESRVTLADVLAQNYETFGITSNVNASSIFHLDQGFQTFLETWNLRDQYRGLDDTSIVLREIESWLDDRDKLRPFFLFANLMDAHLPYDPPPPYDRQFGDVPEEIRELARRPDLHRRVLTGEVQITDEVRKGLTTLYDAEIRRLDEQVGALLELLEERDLADNTMVVITSDHGEHLGEGGRVDHQLSMAEELLHVPLLVRFPSRVQPARIRERVSLAQVFPWFLDASEDRIPEWTPPPEDAPESYLARYFRPVELLDFLERRGLDTSEYDRRWIAAYPTGTDFKYLADDQGRRMLYDLAGAGESVDCFADHAELATQVDRSIARFLQSVRRVEPDTDLQSLEGSMFLEAQEELEALGYAETRRHLSIGVHASEHLMAGIRARRDDDLDLARLELNRALMLAPEQPEVLIELAEVKDALGRDAASFYQRYLNAARSTSLEDTDRYRQARERLEQLRSSNSPSGGGG